MRENIAVFKGKEIRKTFYHDEWWFVISDVVAALVDSADPSGYIKDMRRRDEELSKGWGQIATPLSIMTDGGATEDQLRQSRRDFSDHPIHPIPQGRTVQTLVG